MLPYCYPCCLEASLKCIYSLTVHLQNVVSLLNSVKMCFSLIEEQKKKKFNDKNKSFFFFFFLDITRASMKKKDVVLRPSF